MAHLPAADPSPISESSSLSAIVPTPDHDRTPLTPFVLAGIDHSGVQLVPWQDGMALGDGVDVANLQLRPRPFVDAPSDGSTMQVEQINHLVQSREIVTTSRSLSTLTQLDVEVSGKGWGTSASVAYKSLNGQQMNTREVNAVLSALLIKDRTLWTPATLDSLRLRSDENMTPETFNDKFGDSCIVGFVTAATYMCNFRFSCEDNSKKKIVSAAISGSFGGFGSSASVDSKFSKSIEEACKVSNVSVNVVGTGLDSKPYNVSDLAEVTKVVTNFAQTSGTRMFAIVRSYKLIQATDNVALSVPKASFYNEKVEYSRILYLINSAKALQSAWLFKEQHAKLSPLLESLALIEKSFDNEVEAGRLDVIRSKIDEVEQVLAGVAPIIPPPNPVDPGYANRFRGWFDATGQGVRHDYGRWVGPCQQTGGQIVFVLKRCSSLDEYDFHGPTFEQLLTKPAEATLSVTDEGYADRIHGWFDVTGCGERLDYCRYVGPGPGVPHITFYAKIHTAPENEYHHALSEADVFSRGGPAYSNTVNKPPQY